MVGRVSRCRLRELWGPCEPCVCVSVCVVKAPRTEDLCPVRGAVEGRVIYNLCSPRPVLSGTVRLPRHKFHFTRVPDNCH